MWHPSVFLKSFRSPFTALERKLLTDVQERLPPEPRRLLNAQIAEINLVQRHTEGKEVCCYVIKAGKVLRDPDLRFPAAGEEVKLSTIAFSTGDLARGWKVELHLVEGYLFSLTFEPSPKGIRAETVRIERVDFHADPMQPSHDDDASLEGTVPLRGWVRQWDERFGLESQTPPLPPAERDAKVHSIGAVLPADYLELLEQADGFVVDGCSVLGLREVREVVLESGSYHVVAELHDEGMLGVRHGSQDGRLYLLRYDGAVPEDVGSTFKTAVEGLIDRRGATRGFHDGPTKAS